ncbi:3-oxo-tetronate kinase [Thalassoglobus sp. JC818]|uniref:3-oxo-tetronate kinase n=1 Tax=Thalassoglobus sp. JC818 TaxID=3232136 RepID=UPI00345996BC
MTDAHADSRRGPVLGCIADDVTGATDLATNLVQGGLRVTQFLGVPTQKALREVAADAVVIALKTRSIPVSEAIAESVASLNAMRASGIGRFYFKYCSTFDSTPQGNIGPVAEALMDELKVSQAIFCPAFPANGRTVYQGHLFVYQKLLNESGMENHPLNPMTDSNLIRVLEQQSTRSVGLIDYSTIEAGPEQIRAELKKLADENIQLIISDSCDEQHLQSLAKVAADAPLITGGSGLGRYLGEMYRETGVVENHKREAVPPTVTGRSLVLAGSCSTMTNRQVARMKVFAPAFQIDVRQLMDDSERLLEEVIEWSNSHDPSIPLLVFSSALPETVQQLQQEFGTEGVADKIERFHASFAQHMVNECGVRRLILAGGETSGAVVRQLGISQLQIGPAICPGVPWTTSDSEPSLALALKSGNFGSEHFFREALEMLP